MPSSPPTDLWCTFSFDLRCPFCLVQRDRIASTGLQGRIRYQSVRHERPLPIPAREPTPGERDFVERELATLRERAPEQHLRVPLVWPSTLPAARLVAAANRVRPEATGAFVDELYRAYWRDDRDPSSPLVLGDALRTAGLAGLTATAEDEVTLAAWTAAWEAPPTGKRTPFLRSSRGADLVGLAEPKRIEAFLRSGRLPSASEDAC